jgi:hypothetical protein
VWRLGGIQMPEAELLQLKKATHNTYAGVETFAVQK